MKYEDAIRFFGGTQAGLAAALGITQPSVARWKKSGEIPAFQQLKIQKLSRGGLKADPEVYKVKRGF